MFDDICTHKYYVICLILVKTFNSLHCFAKLRLLLPLELLLWLLPVLLGCWAGVEFCSLHFLLFALLSRLFLCAILNLFIANFFAYSFTNVFVAVIGVFCCISGCKLNSQSYLLPDSYIHVHIFLYISTYVLLIASVVFDFVNIR